MVGRLLLDTNIVVAMIKGDDTVRKVLEGADEVFIPSIIFGELYYGAFNSARSEQNVNRIDGMARHYGEIKTHLRAKGRPIPGNDLWIAAIARQHDLTPASRDEHFREIDTLEVEAFGA